jgi:invasion protein IalB
MQISFKKTLFILAGLAIISAGFFYGKSNIVQASLKEGQKFNDWGANCVVDENKKQVCFLSQQYRITKDKKTEVVAEIQIRYLPANKKLIMIQALPLNVMLIPGTAVISNDKTIAPAKFSVCSATGGCQAMVELSSSDIESILTSENNFIGFINYDGKQANIPISNKGLKEGLAALKS